MNNILKPMGSEGYHDFLVITPKKYWVEFSIKIDGTGNMFRIEKHKLIEMVKWNKLKQARLDLLIQTN